MTPPTEPAVSIITATYNRPEVLAYSMCCVREQTFQYWELLVVGDACSEETGGAVAATADPRIRYINLPENCGEQSGPNNEGLRQARGRFIAFVNHDDLWFPDHLARSLEVLEDTGADLVFSAGLSVEPDGSLRVIAVSEGECYEPNIFAGASSWVFRRELVERVGFWRNYRECYLAPSQDWLFRAWRSGAQLRSLPEVNWIAIMSGIRKGSYAGARGAELHADWYARMHKPGLREEAMRMLPAARAALRVDPVRQPVRALRRAVNRLLFRVGLSSTVLRHILRYGGRGGYIRHLRAVRGLPRK